MSKLAALSVFAIGLSWCAAAAAQSPYGPALAATGGGPRTVAHGDVDNDGFVDVVTGNDSGTLSVLRSLGAGRFAAPLSLPGGSGSGSPIGLALVDIDNDADLDVISVAGSPSSHLSLHRNTAPGVFSAPSSLAVSIYASGLDVGDLDGNGWADVVVCNAGAAEALQIVLNSGTGTLLAPQTFALGAGAGPKDVALADVDSDGDNDIVVASYFLQVGVVLNQGGASFAPVVWYPTPSFNERVGVGDWNQDGWIDLMLGASNQFTTLLNNTLGGFPAATSYPASMGTLRDMTIGDFDADGRLDAVATTFSGYLFTTRGALGGGFLPRQSYYTGASDAVTLADVTGDGLLDALLPRHDRDQLEILPANSNNAFGTRLLTTLNPQLSAFAYGDLDGNGLGDLVWTNTRNSSVRVRLAQPGGTFGVDAIYDLPNVPVGGKVRLARINADAHLDVMVVAGSMRAVLFGNGSGGLGAPIIRSWLTGVNQLVLTDLDGDGLADAAVSKWYFHPSGFVLEGSSIYVGDGLGEFTNVVNSLSQSVAMTTGDFDGDGIDDVARSESFHTYIWRTDGAGGFIESSLPSANYYALAALDLDVDGRLDLVGTSTTESLAVSYGNGAGQLSAPQALHVARGERLEAVDFDADGRTDLVLEGEGSLLSLRNNGGGTVLALGSVHSPSVFSRGLESGDVTGDGRPDLLCGVEFPSGLLVIPHLGPTAGPIIYCTAKTTSNGCVPQIGFSGAPSASATSGFVVQCSNTINNKQGLLIYSLTGQTSVPFQGGVLCLRAPTLRTPVINSLGNPGPDDCSGVFSRDFSAFAHGAGGGTPAPALLVAGTAVTAQWWGRDPLSSLPGSSSLSNALDFVLGP